MALAQLQDTIQTTDEQGFVKVCPRAKVRIYSTAPDTNESPPAGELAFVRLKLELDEIPADLTADNFGAISVWIDSGSYWLASSCCGVWLAKPVCVGCGEQDDPCPAHSILTF